MEQTATTSKPSTITSYECTKCGAFDLDRGINPPAPPALTCYRCGSGRNTTVQEQIARGIGMFPINKESA